MASVALVESWYGGSHRAWADGWREGSSHQIELLTLRDQNWRWRMRAAAVDVAARFEDLVRTRGRPDVVVVSSLFDAASFAGLARRALGSTPMALYVHETQLHYPEAPGRAPDDTEGLVNWKSMLAADAVWWNSDFHRRAFLDGLPGVFRRQPEQPARSGSMGEIESRSTTLWPGVAVRALIGGRRVPNRRPVVLWNQRWDHDKNPRSVFGALAAAAEDGLDFDLVLAGRNQGHSENAEWVRARLGDRILHEGWLSPDDYRSWLLRSDVVVSAADHEFFGIAIVEAVAAGAVPVLPDRLSYPELIGPQWHDHALYPDGDLRRRVGDVLADVDAARRRIDGLRESMIRFDLARSVAAHDRALELLLDRSMHR